MRLDGNMYGESLGGEALDSPYESVFCGTFTGDIRDLTVTLHDLMAGQARPEEVDSVPLIVGLTLDGKSVLPAASPEKPSLWVTSVSDGSDLVETLEFSIAGLGSMTDSMTEPHARGGAGRRTLRLTVSVPIVDPSWFPSAMFAWNAVEAPSGVLFNPDSLAGDRVQAIL